MSFFKFVFYCWSATALFTYVHFVLFVRLHNWDRVIFGFPFGWAWGWFEIFSCSFFGLVAVAYAVGELRK